MTRQAPTRVQSGHSPAARDALSTPTEATLFVAGEATASGGHTATMEGALLTGQRAARQVVQALRGAARAD